MLNRKVRPGAWRHGERAAAVIRRAFTGEPGCEVSALLLLLDGFVAVGAFDSDERAALEEYVTPRVALDGSLVYIIDELGASDDAE